MRPSGLTVIIKYHYSYHGGFFDQLPFRLDMHKRRDGYGADLSDRIAFFLPRLFDQHDEPFFFCNNNNSSRVQDEELFPGVMSH